MTLTGKNFKIWGVRHGIAGDLIFALPVLNYLDIKYPDSFKYWVISKKCSQFAQLFLNHPLIDKIHILENKESLGQRDIELANTCNIIINTEPQCPDGMPGTTGKSCWWNYYNCYEMAFRMAGFDVEEYRKMPKELQYPVLNQWFDVEKQKKTIAIWPFTSYLNSPRAPSKEWWLNFVYLILTNTDYNIYQFGGLNDPDIFHYNGRYTTLTRIKKYNSLPVLDQYKLALGCDININTNSGSGIILGAYGKEQTTLLTNDAPNHFQNPLAFAPLNYKNNNTNIFVPGGFDNLPQETVIEKIKERLQ